MKWRVSPAQRVLNYGAGLCVINHSKEPWGSCEVHRVYRCTGHGMGCLLITLGLVSTVPSAGPSSSLGAGCVLAVTFIARDH